MSEARAFEPTGGRVRTVTVIPPRIRALPGMPALAIQKKRVAAYARVSTNSEEQLTSYGAQVKHYTEYIQSKEYTDHWQFVSVYTDKGITGTSTAKRDGFNRMIQDALVGKIDLIITKSVSRFARNTVDTLTTIRKLKEHGVEVYFEEQNIYTMDGKGEVLLTIMSSIAQEESRNISENVTWGMRKRLQMERCPCHISSPWVTDEAKMEILRLLRRRRRSYARSSDAFWRAQPLRSLPEN